jgi:calcium-dependent protein kinase
VTSILREVQVLRQLKGSLNAVELRDVYEDDASVFIVMEHLEGGELCHRIGERHYSERTVASYMRAVLRTLAQCHSHHILHRDVKPGNFMLANGDDRSPLKAIDFGLAVPYDPSDLPRSDLGLEGTPWYIAPEVLSSQVTPAADVWAAGVMAHQLLTGRLPFDDRRNPSNPSVSVIFKAVLTEELDFTKPW